MPSDRAVARNMLLTKTGWDQAVQVSVAGDASNRRYDRLTNNSGETVILMDAPAERGEDIRPFIEIAKLLIANGLSAPAIFESDPKTGLLLLEDLGDDLLARVLIREPELETELYIAAIDALIHLQNLPVPKNLPAYDPPKMHETAMLAADWYLDFTQTLSDKIRTEYSDLISKMLAGLTTDHAVLVHRDYHAENLLWLPHRAGISRIGILDFQDAMTGHPAYDLASLLADARRDVPEILRVEMIEHYLIKTGKDREAFLQDYAILSAQRNLRILGVFTRLCIRDAKSQYARLIPRVWANLFNDLAHPSLSEILKFVTDVFPEPTQDLLDRMARKNG